MKLLSFLLLCFPSVLFAQISMSGVVVDSNNQALPWTNIVLLNKNIGTITNEKGLFILPIIPGSDSIKITNIAYYPKVVAVKDFRNNDTIRLTQNIPQLKEVVVRNFATYKQDIDIGIKGYPNNGEFIFGPGQQIATYIANEQGKQGWIKGVSFKVKNFGKCKNSMRVRLLRLDTINFKPSMDLLDESIVIKSSALKRTNYIDLSAYKIILPKEGVFIALEWIYPDTICDKNSYTTIAANLSLPSDLVSFNFRDREWKRGNRPRMLDGNFMTPNVWLKVGY